MDSILPALSGRPLAVPGYSHVETWNDIAGLSLRGKLTCRSCGARVDVCFTDEFLEDIMGSLHGTNNHHIFANILAYQADRSAQHASHCNVPLIAAVDSAVVEHAGCSVRLPPAEDQDALTLYTVSYTHTGSLDKIIHVGVQCNQCKQSRSATVSSDLASRVIEDVLHLTRQSVTHLDYCGTMLEWASLQTTSQQPRKKHGNRTAR